MLWCDEYYDVRYLLLPLIGFLKSYDDGAAITGGIFTTEVRLVLVFGFLAAFLLTSIHIQLCCSQRRRSFTCNRAYEWRFGRSALSVPVAICLATTLYFPMSGFLQYAYIPILVLSFWSDFFHSFITRFSHIDRRRLLSLPETAAVAPPPPEDGNLQQEVPTLSIEQIPNEVSIEEGVTLA